MVNYRARVLTCYRLLQKYGYAIKNPGSRDERHVAFLVQHGVVESELSPSMVQNYLSVLSWWTALMGQPNLIKPLLQG